MSKVGLDGESQFGIFLARWLSLFVKYIANSAIQELHHLSHNFREVFGFAFIDVFICLQASFYVDEASLAQVLIADLAEPFPGFDIDPLGIFLVLTVPVLPALAYGNAKMGDLFSGGSEFTFWIFP